MTAEQKTELIARVTGILETSILIQHSKISYTDQGKTVEMSFDLVIKRETADESWSEWGGVWNSPRRFR